MSDAQQTDVTPDGLGNWFRRTPESERLLAEEIALLEDSERHNPRALTEETDRG